MKVYSPNSEQWFKLLARSMRSKRKNTAKNKDSCLSDWIITRCNGIIEAGLGADLIALNIEQGICYGFNSTAARVWQMLEHPRRLRELSELLVKQFNVEAEVCESDLRDLLRGLEQDGLVSIDSTAS